MASFYSSEGDMLPTAYMLNQKFPSYPSSELNSNKEYATQSPVPFPHINMLPSSSVSDHEFVQSESIESRDEMVFMPPTRLQVGLQQIERRSDVTPHYSDGSKVLTDTLMYPKESLNCSGSEPIPQYHGLSLTLGSQEPSLVQLHSDLNQFTSSSFCSMLNSEIQMSQNNDLKNVQYLSFDLGGQTQDAAPNSLQNMFTSTDSSFIPSVRQEVDDVARMFCSSKYLKAAQDLLSEVVSVHRAPKLSETEMKRDVSSADLQESNNELSPTERNELQIKITKLMDMLDEVDRRYKQYCHQMQTVVSSFDMMAGRGSAKPYTALASRTISRQFGTLRNAIKKQIQVIQKSLGEQDGNPHGLGVLSRLRYVDQQLRQQKAIQHFGIMRQPWRPQRGLPENAVSVLRAWLFEHFLNPYPKDSEKLVLARQTGLTRSQVANWFINARVRLWKPMIEDMYKDEFGDTETELKSSPENVTTAQDIPAFDDKEEDFQGSLMSADANRQGQSNESMLDFISSSQIDGSAYDNGAIQGKGVNFGLSIPNKQMAELGNDIFCDNNNPIASSNKAGSENVIATDAGRHYDMIMDNATANQVSLALGLHHNDEKDSKSMVHTVKQKETDISTSSEALDKLDYYYTDPVNNQHRFSNTHLLSDFVA